MFDWVEICSKWFIAVLQRGATGNMTIKRGPCSSGRFWPSEVPKMLQRSAQQHRLQDWGENAKHVGFVFKTESIEKNRKDNKLRLDRRLPFQKEIDSQPSSRRVQRKIRHKAAISKDPSHHRTQPQSQPTLCILLVTFVVCVYSVIYAQQIVFDAVLFESLGKLINSWYIDRNTLWMMRSISTSRCLNISARLSDYSAISKYLDASQAWVCDYMRMHKDRTSSSLWFQRELGAKASRHFRNKGTVRG